jgi:hypothetical protein
MEISVWAHIDSGADFSFFPGGLASVLGITIPNNRPLEFLDVGGTRHMAYFDLIEIDILDRTTYEVLHKFKMEAGFSDAIDRDAGILGIHGFFAQFQAVFQRNQVELLPL